MNYENASHFTLEYNYYYNSAHLFVLVNGGEVVDYGAINNTAPYSRVCEYVSSYQSRNLDKDVIGFVYKGYLDGGTYISLTNKMDWLALRTTNNYCEVSEYKYVNDSRTTPNDYFNVGLTTSQNYYNLGYVTYENAYNINYSAELSTGQWCLFDYNYVSNVSLQQENYLTFYTTILDYYIDLNDETTYEYELYIGSNLADAKAQSYNNGYNNGHSVGYNNGYNNGFNDGFAQGQAGAGTQETAHAFTYITQAFGAVTDILSIEVLPHVTLGVCFSIPLVLVLIMTIFRLIKK